MDKNIIIIDHGRWGYKIGYSCENEPKILRSPGIIRENYFDGRYTEKEIVFAHENVSCVNIPIRDSIINDFMDMEYIWEHIFFEYLNIKPKEEAIIFIESIYASKTQRMRIAEILFKGFEFSSICFVNMVKLSCICNLGIDSGILVDCGYENTRIVPFYLGNVIDDGVLINRIGGKHISQSIYSSIKIRCGVNSHKIDYELVDQIKAKHCFLKSKFSQFSESKNETQIISVDFLYKKNDILEVGDEIFKAPEIMFQPENIGSKDKGVHLLIKEAIMKIENLYNLHLSNKIVLCGGNSLIRGFRNRLIDELISLQLINFNVVDIDQPGFLAWYGAKKFCASSFYDTLKIERSEFLKNGAKSLNTQNDRLN